MTKAHCRRIQVGADAESVGGKCAITLSNLVPGCRCARCRVLPVLCRNASAVSTSRQGRRSESTHQVLPSSRRCWSIHVARRNLVARFDAGGVACAVWKRVSAVDSKVGIDPGQNRLGQDRLTLLRRRAAPKVCGCNGCRSLLGVIDGWGCRGWTGV